MEANARYATLITLLYNSYLHLSFSYSSAAEMHPRHSASSTTNPLLAKPSLVLAPVLHFAFSYFTMRHRYLHVYWKTRSYLKSTDIQYVFLDLELEESLANEEPMNHSDYRHLLDSKGQRQGRVIDYRVSELRVVDLLDGLCAKMGPYVPNQAGPGREFLVESGRWSARCSRNGIQVLETTEEELTEKLRAGGVATGDVERVLCRELSKSCKETARSDPLLEDFDQEDLDDEEHESNVSEDAANMGSEGEL